MKKKLALQLLPDGLITNPYNRQLGEDDHAYRSRLVELLPRGATYYAEDLGNAYGDNLDALAGVLAEVYPEVTK